MKLPDASPFSAWPPRARLAFILGTLVVYVFAFPSLYHLVGGSIAMLSLVPVAAGGWLFGLRVGLIAGLLVSLLNAILFGVVTGPGWITVVQSGPAFILLILAGAAAGWVSELLDQVKEQSRELERDREALKEQIDQRQRAEEALAKSEKLAVMGQLLAGVTHELNNLLTVVLSGAELMRTMVGSGPLREEAEEIAQAAERCARIVRNFLALARQRPPEWQPVSLNLVVQEAVGLLSYALQADNVQVTLNLVRDLPILQADPHQLHQVVVNLMSNAHQAMRETVSPRRITLTTRFDPVQGMVTLEVADTGPGIPPEIRPRIFESFFTTKPAGEGTGLGLSLCQNIIRGHGGTIRVESPPGQGAIFQIALPVDSGPRGELKAPGAEPTPIRAKRILVVDDEPTIAKMLMSILSADGHQVDTAANGALALEKLRERAYDLILSDIKMPELDGLGLYREVERHHPELRRRIVFFTGDASGPQTKAFLAQTGAPFLSKPVLIEEVRRMVRMATPAG